MSDELDDLNTKLLRGMLPALYKKAQEGDQRATETTIRILAKIERLDDKNSPNSEPEAPALTAHDFLSPPGFRERWQRAVQDELRRLTMPELRKKRNTILALLDARLSSKPDNVAFAVKDGNGESLTCSSQIWYAKWSKDPVIADVLEKAMTVAFEIKDGHKLSQLAQASEIMMMASPAAAQALAAMAAFGYMDIEIDGVPMRVPIAAAERLRAVTGLLDRAGIETAEKTASPVTSVVTVYIPENGRDDRDTPAVG